MLLADCIRPQPGKHNTTIKAHNQPARFDMNFSSTPKEGGVVPAFAKSVQSKVGESLRDSHSGHFPASFAARCCTSTGIFSSSMSITRSDETPSLWAWKVVTMRCRRTG